MHISPDWAGQRPGACKVGTESGGSPVVKPDFHTATHQQHGLTEVLARDGGQRLEPDLAKESPRQTIYPQGLAHANRKQIKWHSKLTG
eukprot:535799-Karenia_brevis.AAC.1